MTAAVADGAVPGDVKELVALAIAVAGRCDGCVAHHAQGSTSGRACHCGAGPPSSA